MCIIAVKPAGAKLPSPETIRNMWIGNPDGAGIMYAHGGKVHIDKGHMTLDDFLLAMHHICDKVDAVRTPIILHFRVMTHGTRTPGCTHPFPISANIADLTALQTSCRLAAAHNGIIWSAAPKNGLSDTQEYILSQLAPLYSALPTFPQAKGARDMIANATGSKWAFLDAAGKIALIGDFITRDGVYYSNRSFDSIAPARTTACATQCDDDMPEHSFDYLMFLPPSSVIRAGYDIFGADIDDFYLDSSGRVYWYDWDADAARPLPDATAYTSNGSPIYFSPDSYDIELVRISAP